jgi:hypothetical protein
MTLQLAPTLKRALRDNKNSRLHILLVLLSQACGPVPIATPASEIAHELNLNRDTVNDALSAMERDGYVSKVTLGWIASTKARQLPLSTLFLESGMEALQSGLLPDPGGDCFAAPGRKISASSVVVVDQIDPNQLADQQQQTTHAAEAEKSRSADREGVRAALKAVGIKPGRHHRELIADPWVTVERVRHWQIETQRMIAEDAAELTNCPGYIIRRLIEHEEPPVLNRPIRDSHVAASHSVAEEWARVLAQRKRS